MFEGEDGSKMWEAADVEVGIRKNRVKQLSLLGGTNKVVVLRGLESIVAAAGCLGRSGASLLCFMVS